jgi:Fibronectin type III domain
VRRLYLALITFLICSVAANARSGCCSSHGGVCGCSCCDGTPLSQTCLPYYPNCGGGGGGGGGSYPAPSSLGGSAVSSTSCMLIWTDNSSGEENFQIEDREIHQSEYILVNSVSGNTTSALIDHLSPGTTYSFRVRAHSAGNSSDYSNETTVTTFPNPGTLCQAPAVCFNQSRFSVVAQWKTPDGRSGTGTVVRLTDDSGYFWFFDPTNVEAVFKVLNACGLNHAFWFYAGGLTNVQVTLTVTDTKTGAVKTYTNTQGKPFQPIQDSAAFSTCP